MRSVQDYQAKAAAARAMANLVSAYEVVANHYRAIAAHWEMLANERHSILEWKREQDLQTPSPD